jgi:hypothetical protein
LNANLLRCNNEKTISPDASTRHVAPPAVGSCTRRACADFGQVDPFAIF